MSKDVAIKKCLEARKQAVARKTFVGACIYSDNKYIIGFNLENCCHKGYHAEEVAVINCILQNINPKEMKGIIVSFTSDAKELTFACGHCRQILWEYFFNPSFLLTEVNIHTGEIVSEKTLGEMYPLPYPLKGRFKKGSIN